MKPKKNSNKIKLHTKTDADFIKKIIDEADAKKISKNNELLLLTEVRNGNIEAVEKLIEAWEYYIVKITMGFKNKGISVCELIEIGKQHARNLILSEIGSKQKTDIFWYVMWFINHKIKIYINENRATNQKIK